MIAFYKPNPKVTGAACSFKADTKLDSSKGVFTEFVKQVAWNADKRTGSFSGGEQATLKFSINEVGDMLNALEKNVPAFPQFNKDAGAYHKSPTGSAQIRFCPYIDSKTGEQRGFSLSVSKKEDGKDKKFVIGFTFAEMVVLREFLKWTLDRIFTAQHSAEKKKFEDLQKAKKSPKPKSAEPAKTEVVEEEVDSDLF